MLSLIEAAAFMGLEERELYERISSDRRISFEQSNFSHRSVKLPHSSMRLLLQSAGMRFRHRRLTIGIEKGGVGKSFLSVNTAVRLASRGCRVLLIDLDPQACSTNLLLPEDTDYSVLPTVLEVFNHPSMQFSEAVAHSSFEGLDIIPCKGKARRLHRTLASENPLNILPARMEGLEFYDLIMFDVPPTFGDIISSAYLASDLVVMPTFPDIWSIESIDLTLEDINDACEEFGCSRPECRVLLNRYAPSRSATKEAVDELQENYSDILLPFFIKDTAAVQNTINEGESVFADSSARQVRQALDKLADFICPLKRPDSSSEGENCEPEKVVDAV